MNKENSKTAKRISDIIEKWLFPFLKECPHIIQPGIGIDAFVDDLIKAAIKFPIDSEDTTGAINLDLRPYIHACPQIIKAGIGMEAFVDELTKAAIKFNSYTRDKLSREA